MQAEFLVGAHEKNALIIPRFSALRDNQGNYYVFIVKNNILNKRFIKIGIATDSKFSILQGITSTETIVSQPTAEMHNDMKL